MREQRGLVILLACCVLQAACSTLATVTYRDQARVRQTLEAKIIGNDDQSVVLESDQETVKVRKEDILEIKHPGGVVTTIGAVILAPALVATAVAVGLFVTDTCSPGEFCEGWGQLAAVGVMTVAIVPLTVGGALVGWGVSVSQDSKERAGEWESVGQRAMGAGWNVGARVIVRF